MYNRDTNRKPWKGKTFMKPSKRLAPMLLLLFAFIGIGCSHSERAGVERVVRSELDLLKNLDNSTVQKYISYTDLFPKGINDSQITEEIENAFTLFFRNFDYEIQDIDVDPGSGKGTVNVHLRTLDARSLARDYNMERLRSEILSVARQEEETASGNLSLKDRYLLLWHLLTDRTYDLVDKECKIHLEKTGGKWTIVRTASLENDLVGGLISCLSDPNLLSPEEILSVCFNTLKEMNTTELSNYLGIASLLSDESPENTALASALASQILSCFDYEVLESRVKGYQAQVDMNITSFDSDAILAEYQKETQAYLSSPQAVIDGAQIRHEHCLSILESCITDNKATIQTPVTFHLINDGGGWNLQEDSTELGTAIFGSFPQDESLLSDPFYTDDETAWEEEA